MPLGLPDISEPGRGGGHRGEGIKVAEVQDLKEQQLVDEAVELALNYLTRYYKANLDENGEERLGMGYMSVDKQLTIDGQRFQVVIFATLMSRDVDYSGVRMLVYNQGTDEYALLGREQMRLDLGESSPAVKSIYSVSDEFDQVKLQKLFEALKEEDKAPSESKSQEEEEEEEASLNLLERERGSDSAYGNIPGLREKFVKEVEKDDLNGLAKIILEAYLKKVRENNLLNENDGELVRFEDLIGDGSDFLVSAIYNTDKDSLKQGIVVTVYRVDKSGRVSPMPLLITSGMKYDFENQQLKHIKSEDWKQYGYRDDDDESELALGVRYAYYDHGMMVPGAGSELWFREMVEALKEYKKEDEETGK